MGRRSEVMQAKFDAQADKLWDSVQQDILEGKLLNEIAKKYKMTHQRIKALCLRHGTSWKDFRNQIMNQRMQRVVQDIADGMSRKDVAEKYNISDTTIGRYLTTTGNSKPNDRLDIDTFKVKELYDRGFTVNRIAKHFNTSHETIMKRLAKLGVTCERSKGIEHHECAGCDDGVSEHRSFIHSLVQRLEDAGIRCEENNRTVLVKGDGKPLEIDVWLPDYNLGVEVNPTFTHSVDVENSRVSKRYHQTKAFLACDRGVGLLHVYDADIHDERRREVLFEQLLSLKGKRKVGARQCIVKDVASADYSEFLNKYHFQGADKNSSVKKGLYYHDKLVGVMSFGVSRYTKDDYELIRYCMNPHLIVIGGFDKLFKHCVAMLEKPCSIVAFMDLNKRMQAGNVYEKHGFACEGLTDPDYVWSSRDGSKCYSRYSTQKSKLVKMGFSSDLSEIQIMSGEGYFRVYGAGSRKYVLRLE